MNCTWWYPQVWGQSCPQHPQRPFSLFWRSNWHPHNQEELLQQLHIYKALQFWIALLRISVGGHKLESFNVFLSIHYILGQNNTLKQLNNSLCLLHKRGCIPHLVSQRFKNSPEEFTGQMKLLFWWYAKVSPAIGQTIVLPTTLVMISKQLQNNHTLIIETSLN